MTTKPQPLQPTPADLVQVAEKAGLRPGLPPKWTDMQAGRLLERPVFAAENFIRIG